METITLFIPNMKSPHCQMVVSQAIKAAGGTVRAMSPQKVELDLNSSLTKETVVEAITKAGYKVSSLQVNRN